MRLRVREIIFEAETKAGKAFDIALIICIVLSVVAVMFDSMAPFKNRYGHELYLIEWFFTLIFTMEYVLRLWSIGQPLRYAKSFFGIVDLIAVLPTYVSLLLPGSQYFIVIRILRVLRIFRILKFVQYMDESRQLLAALHASRKKIEVFLFTVLTLVVILGSCMYLIEGEQHGFNNIPQSIYWAIVKLTTVGYGDLTPQTPLGQAVASMVMILGYGIIAVPTGIVTVELSRTAAHKRQVSCPGCALYGHDGDAEFCKHCGEKLLV